MKRESVKAEKSSPWYPNTHASFRDDDGFQHRIRAESGRHEYYPPAFAPHRHTNEPLRYGQWPFDPHRMRMFEENYEPKPFFPSFSGKQEEWESFWLKFELLSERYRWSPKKNKENSYC